MTEHQPRPIDLTSQANPNRLEVRGDIFMAEGSATGPEQNPQQEQPQQRMTPEDVATRLERARARSQVVETEESQGGYGRLRTDIDYQQDQPDKILAEFNPHEWMRYVDKASPENGERRLKDSLRYLSPHTEALPLALIRRYIDTKNLDYLVNRIISQPLDAESSNYRLSFYGGINLDQIKDILRAESDNEPRYKAQYRRVLIMSEAVELFHHMNREIAVTGGIQQFVEGSKAINPEQLQAMQDVKGVAQVMRLFDLEYQRILAEKNYVSQREYDEMMGIARKAENGTQVETRYMGTVEKQFYELTQSEALPEELRNLDAWEIAWAFNVGKILFNLTLRSAEQISLGEVPTGDRGAASIPQESAARVMNWLGWTGLRFHISETRGGVEFMNMVVNRYQKMRAEQGYGETSITKIGGKELKDFELAGMFGVAGIWSSWRNGTIVLEHAPTHYTKPDFIEYDSKSLDQSVKGFIELQNALADYELRQNLAPGLRDKLRHEIIAETNGRLTDDTGATDEQRGKFAKELYKRFTAGFNAMLKDDNNLKELYGSKKPDLLVNTYLENGELREEFTNALGIILKTGGLNSSEKDNDSEAMAAAKMRIRAAIWRRVARDNPLALVGYLRGIGFADGKFPQDVTSKGLEDLKKALTTGDEIWDSLKPKLLDLQERRMVSIRGGSPKTLDILISEKGPNYLSFEEKGLLSVLREYGKNVSGELAKVRFPFNPFMNDVVYETVEYGEAGAEVYRRRAGGDFGSFYNAHNELVKIVDNPTGISWEDALKALHGVVQGLGIPLGIDTGQDRVFPFLQAYIHFIERGGQYEGKEHAALKAWLAKDNIYGAIAQTRRIPTSIAQIYGGHDAMSLDEFEILKFVDTALHMGITRKGKEIKGEAKWADLDEILRKKYKIKITGLLAAFLRDILPVFAVVAIGELSKDIGRPPK